MAVRDGTSEVADRSAVDHEDVRAFSTRPDRFVFVVSGRSDAWIASDLTVPVRE